MFPSDELIQNIQKLIKDKTWLIKNYPGISSLLNYKIINYKDDASINGKTVEEVFNTKWHGGLYNTLWHFASYIYNYLDISSSKKMNTASANTLYIISILVIFYDKYVDKLNNWLSTIKELDLFGDSKPFYIFKSAPVRTKAYFQFPYFFGTGSPDFIIVIDNIGYLNNHGSWSSSKIEINIRLNINFKTWNKTIENIFNIQTDINFSKPTYFTGTTVYLADTKSISTTISGLLHLKSLAKKVN